MKLTTTTDFVLEQKDIYFHTRYIKIENYAKFLKQPLEKCMFVPCGEGGNVLEIPDLSDANGRQYDSNVDEDLAWSNYQKAKKRVLFEGFEHKHIKTTHENYYVINNKNITWLSWNNSKTIESLLEYNQDLTLTDSAIKKLGL